MLNKTAINTSNTIRTQTGAVVRWGLSVHGLNVREAR